ncbi:MAG: hypothetical protein ACLQM8_20915, partial [Limisphaerales bacterium]
GRGFSCFHLAHALHFETLAITNRIHGYSDFVIPKYQPISGRDRRYQPSTVNSQPPTRKAARSPIKAS